MDSLFLLQDIDPEIELGSPALQADSLPATREAQMVGLLEIGGFTLKYYIYRWEWGRITKNMMVMGPDFRDTLAHEWQIQSRF